MGKLDGRVAIVTGAASGLGRASAALFVAEGARVIFADLNEEGAQQAAEEAAPGASDRASAERVDVTRLEDCARMVTAALTRYGRLDILVTCAGSGESAPFSDLDEATFTRTLTTNLTGTFLSVKAALPALTLQGGRIITLASVAGIIAGQGLSVYAASKAGVIHLTRNVALEYASQHIRANAIAPSWIWTPMVQRTFERVAPGMPPEAVRAYLARQSPMGRMGTPEDVAKAALFLASDDSAFITGQVLVLDGGMTLGPQPV